jgi:ribosome-associated translation inhibitor RaiA
MVLVRADVSEQLIAFIMRVERISKLGTALKNGIFWNVTPCGSHKNQRFGVTYHVHLPGENIHREDGGDTIL